MVADDFDFGWFAVDEQMHAGGMTGAIIGEGQMHPFVGRDGGLATDLERIPGPLTVDADGQRAIENGSVRVKWPLPGKVNPLSPLSSAAWPFLPGTSFGPSCAVAGFAASTLLVSLLSLISSNENAATNPGTVGSAGVVSSHSAKAPRAASRRVVGRASRLPLGRLAPGSANAGVSPARTGGTPAPLPGRLGASDRTASMPAICCASFASRASVSASARSKVGEGMVWTKPVNGF